MEREAILRDLVAVLQQAAEIRKIELEIIGIGLDVLLESLSYKGFFTLNAQSYRYVVCENVKCN